jgi:hypothetical protein
MVYLEWCISNGVSRMVYLSRAPYLRAIVAHLQSRVAHAACSLFPEAGGVFYFQDEIIEDAGVRAGNREVGGAAASRE